MTEEEKKKSRRARRAKLGQDLFATQADKPFLLPPKWTFVFRAFSTIDGIGKGLHPGGYDLSRISQHARAHHGALFPTGTISVASRSRICASSPICAMARPRRRRSRRSGAVSASGRSTFSRRSVSRGRSRHWRRASGGLRRAT